MTTIAAPARSKPAIALVLDGANPPQLRPLLEAHFQVHGIPVSDGMSRSVAAFAGEIRALVTATLVGADHRLIGALPRLELIACTGGHVDRIDRQAAAVRNIRLARVPGASAPDVADLAIALMLAVARRVCESDRFVRAGRWTKSPMPFGRRVNGKRLGIVGLGSIGRIVARRAEAFDMQVVYHGRGPKDGVPYRYYDDVAAMAADVDFLSLHCKSGPETRHMIDAKVLRALGPDGFLINAARGAVVDQPALIRALRDGTIAGAGLDVFTDEPDVPTELMAFDNVVVQPHHGAFTHETKQIMSDTTLANLLAHFAGRPVPHPAG